jgi:exosome complex component CSL4
MNDFINKRISVGQKIAKYNQEELLQGLYIYKDYVYASILGVFRKNEKGAYYVENKFPVQCFDIRVGDTVYGQVKRIREEEAFVTLLQINEISLSRPIEATIRKEHVR